MKRSVSPWVYLCLIFISLALTAGPAFAQSTNPKVAVLGIDGTISPINDSYLERGLKAAEQRGASLVILTLNTPGGSIDSMNSMVQKIRGSSIPVVVYVSPRGAMAASAGTLITLAGHADAMAPETIIGAASPVNGQGQDLSQTMETKVKEALKATARTLTENRPPAATQLAEQAIDQARAVTVDEALAAGLVDIKAFDLPDLLDQLDGRTVQMAAGSVTLHTQKAEIIRIPFSFIEQVLQILVDPNLVFVLLSLGIMAILIELASPGGWVAGFIGVVSLLLAVYGLGALPVNWFGALFLVLAFVLFIVELKTPSVGLLTAAGAASFIGGALIMFNSVDLAGVPKLSIPLVVGTGIFLAAGFLGIVMVALHARRLPVQTGQEALPGRSGMARSDLNPNGTVYAAGEMWQAELIPGEECPLPEGTKVVIVEVQGLTLKVRKA